jgi:hypothetical protein
MFARRFRCGAVICGPSEFRMLFPDASRRWIFHCQVHSGSGCVLLFSDVLDCCARRHFREPREAPTRCCVQFPEHIAILQSAASSALSSVIWRESRSASRSRFPRCENARVFLRTMIENPMIPSGRAFHSLASASRSVEMHWEAQSAEGPNVAELIDLPWDGGPRLRSADEVPAWQCRFCGSVPVLRHAKSTVVRGSPQACNDEPSVRGWLRSQSVFLDCSLQPPYPPSN